MVISTMQEKFAHGVRDIYDAEHRFLEAMQTMRQNATDKKLKDMLTTHIRQTEQHVKNVEQVFKLLDETPVRQDCAGAKGIIAEGEKGLKETEDAPAIRDCEIAGAANKAEHYEIAAYRGLIADAQAMRLQDVARLLQQNLAQEEETSRLIEQSAPQFLQQAMGQSFVSGDDMNPVVAP